MDNQTAKQGPAYFENEDYDEIMKLIVQLAAIRGAKGRNVKWYGIKDTQIIVENSFEYYLKLFPKSKYITIVRDPRSVTVSVWYFNIKIDPYFIEKRGKNKEHWSKQVAEFWYRENTNLLEFYKKHPSQVLIVRYEDLRLAPFENYKKIFEFLEVNTNDELIEKIVEKTSFEKFKDGKFFRKASLDEWKRELPPEGIKSIETRCKELMKYFGYEPVYIKY